MSACESTKALQARVVWAHADDNLGCGQCQCVSKCTMKIECNSNTPLFAVHLAGFTITLTGVKGVRKGVRGDKLHL